MCSPLLGHLGEAGQRILPEGLQKPTECAQSLRVDRVDPPGRLRTIDDQAGELEHLEVLADRGTGHGEISGDVHDRQRTVPEALKDQPAGAIPEGIENRLLGRRE